MLTPIGVVLIGIGFVCACLITIYLYAIRLNNCASSQSEQLKCELELEQEVSTETINNSKKNKKKAKNINNNSSKSPKNSYSEAPLTPAESPKVIVASFDEEDDLIALASLRGYDISGISRRKNVISPATIEFKIKEAPKRPEVITISKSIVEEKKIEESAVVTTNVESTIVVESIESTIVVESTKLTEVTLIGEPEHEKLPEKQLHEKHLHEQNHVFESQEWSSVPTREEEAAKNLKNKIANLQAELEDSEMRNGRSASQFEQAQKKCLLLEKELAEQMKMASSMKSSYESQIGSLRSVNQEIVSKVSMIETEAFNGVVLKKEVERSKETISHLQAELLRFEKEKDEFVRKVSELENENNLLREKASLVEDLNEKNMKLEEELEETRREMCLQVETSETEIQLTRAKLEGEIAFHRAEHANSVGSSTALHQEILQLKSELEKLTLTDSQYQDIISDFKNNELFLRSLVEKVKFDLGTEINYLKEELDAKTNEKMDLENEYQILSTDLSTANETISSLTAEVSVLKSEISEVSKAESSEKSDPMELENLREKLAEAEIKISGLQSDLNREIKRADISKKVYEAKVAELEKMK